MNYFKGKQFQKDVIIVAKLLSQLDKRNNRKIEYWSKGEANENKVN